MTTPNPADNPFDHNAECRYCDEQDGHRGDCPWLLARLAELQQFYQLFSDYEEPCDSFAHAQAIWNAMKDRETKLHEEIRRLKAQHPLPPGTFRHPTGFGT